MSDRRRLRRSPFLALAARQLASNLRAAPATLAERLSDEGRASRCRSIGDLREAARRTLPRPVFDFVEGAAGDELTAARNRSALEQLSLWPAVLRDVSEISLETTVLGERLALPILGAPHGAGLLFHPDGEAGIARALHRAGTVYVISSMASQSIEELAEATPGGRWFQMYMWRDRGLNRELLERAHDAGGYSALVLTVDTPRVGSRERDLRNGFSLPPRITPRTLASGLRRPRWSARFLRSPEVGLANVSGRDGRRGPVDLGGYAQAAFDASASWSDVDWLREHWAGPLVLKGILSPADATRAAAAGVDAVVVSNHGGRQLDGAPATIEALPGVVDAVGGEVEVLVDGGIRRGADVARALISGARACLVGRPLIYGLAAGGEAGAARALEILRTELELTLTLLGRASVTALDRDCLGTGRQGELRSPSRAEP